MPVTVQELFGGGVPEGKEDETAHALGLSASGTTVLRVDCETGTFHFALKDGSLLFVLDNIVYTMERAKLDTGPGYSGPSLIVRRRAPPAKSSSVSTRTFRNSTARWRLPTRGSVRPNTGELCDRSGRAARLARLHDEVLRCERRVARQ